MPHQVDPDELVHRAAEALLGDASLRDELTDSEAQPLIDWGLAQATALARSAAVLPDAEPAVEEALKGLRRLMKRINRFVGLRVYHDPDALAGELDRLRVVSAKLYGERPALLPDEAARYALVDEIEGMDNAQVVERLLALFGPQGAASAAPAADAASPATPPEATRVPGIPHPPPSAYPADPHAPEPPAQPASRSLPPARPLESPDQPQEPPAEEAERRPESPLSGLLHRLGWEAPPDDDPPADDAPHEG